MATHQDDGFHEIQLNGKQLVFLFMAATVVSVVIFLCGVLVGRGVRAERGADPEGAPFSSTEPAPEPPVAATAAPPASDPTAAAAPPPVDELSYFDRLQSSTPAAEKLKVPGQASQAPPAPKPPAPAPRAAATRAAAQPARAAATRAAEQPAGAPAAGGEPPGAGFAVQVAALNIRSEADAIAKRLASKGYAAYVTSPANGTPQIFRVRVGKFGTRREAETVAAKLEKEEQFKPWITR